MRLSVLVSVCILFGLGCGKAEGLLNSIPEPAPTVTTDPCVTSEVMGVGTVQSCSEEVSILDGDQNVIKVLSRVQVSETQVKLLASKKNGGVGGSQFYNSSVSLTPVRNFNLPTVLNILEGNAGNGQKLYLTFNGGLSCAYFSSAGNKYQNPRCFLGATHAPGNSNGFTGGSEVGNASVAGISSVAMSVNGASGSGIITRVEITLQ